MTETALKNETSTGTTLSGVVKTIRFRGNNEFYIFRIEDSAKRIHTVKGTLPNIRVGLPVVVEGTMETHPVFGPTMKAHSISMVPVVTSAAIASFLGSGAVRNIGEKYATKIIEHFGEKSFDILEQENAESLLRTVDGIGKKRAHEIVSSWKREQSLRNLIAFCSNAGLSPRDAIRIHNANISLSQLQKDPFRLIEMKLIPREGFRKIDSLAQEAGFVGEHPRRVLAGALYLLENAGKEGHTALMLSEMKRKLSELLSIDADNLDWTQIGKATGGLRLFSGNSLEVSQNDPPIFVTTEESYESEQFIAKNLISRLTHAPSPPVQKNFCGTGKTSAGIELTVSQKGAVDMIMTHRVSLLTGGPGTGKTTILSKVIENHLAGEMTEEDIILCAPTGRAARRLEQATSFPAHTIHKTLGLGSFSDRKLPVERARLVIVDETSMLDVALMCELLLKVPKTARLVFVGDAFQLPSVGPGRILGDLIESGVLPLTTLTEVHRQGSESEIPVAAASIKNGKIPESGKDFRMAFRQDSSEIVAEILHLIKHVLPAQGVSPDDVQVLVPMKRGETGTIALNKVLQKELNPRNGPFLQGPFCNFFPGDRVMQIRNDYDKGVMNGETGKVVAVDNDPRDGYMIVSYDERVPVRYRRDELEDLSLSYAVSIHKSQGSEYPAVIICLDKAHWILLERHLVYTGVTRGKNSVHIVGHRMALGRAVGHVATINRTTGLKQFMKDEARTISVKER